MKKDPKILLIFPPVATPVSPYISTPLLAGQLKAAGYDVKCLDLSLEFFDYVLRYDYLKNAYEKAKALIGQLDELLQGKTSKDEEFDSYPFEIKKAIVRKYRIEKVLERDSSNLRIIENVEKNIDCYRNREKFYNPDEVEKACKELHKALELAVLVYYPVSLMFNVYSNNLYNTNYEALKEQAFDEKENIFHEFYKDMIKKFKIDEYDIICFSCPNETQILPAMTLSGMLKKICPAKIAMGGNIISRIDKELKSMPEAFDLFWDYLMTGCGEESIVRFADYILKGTGSIKRIKGLIYKSNGKIYSNKPDYNYKISKSAIMCLDGLDLNKYFAPDIILPIQSSKGCYWGKCTFCGLHCPAKKYTVKPPKSVVDEIEYIHKNYGINIFEFIDEAMHPEYLSKLADEIISRNLNVKWNCCARLEMKVYTEELCQKLYKSGLRLVQFGFESAAPRIYSMLNKGIKYDNRMEVVKLFANAGIFTYLFAIIGYPGETREEAMQTVNIIDKYRDIIDVQFIHKFWLDKKAPAFKKYKKIGISEVLVDKHDIFNQKCDFIAEKGMRKNEVDEVYNIYMDKTFYVNYMFTYPDEYFFLYAINFERDKVKEILS